MNWQEVVKSSESYWKPTEPSWNFCGFCCLGDSSAKPSQDASRHSVIDKEKRITHYWSKEDDRKLTKLVERYKNDWDTIADKFSDKSSSQISNRWKNKLDPTLKKSKWTDEEDLVLKTLVLEFGYQWENLAKYLKGRSTVEIKKRFNNTILPGLGQRELIQLQEALSPKVYENGSSMDIDFSLNESNKEECLMILNKRVEDLHIYMKDTLEQIEKLEVDIYESQNLLS